MLNCNLIIMNRKFLLIGVYFVFIAIILACASKKEESHDHHMAVDDPEVWEEMDAFHMVMAETYHPFKDSANLEPVKTRASELMAVANEWILAPLPAKVDNDEVRSNLQKLKDEASALAETIKTSDDNVIADQLTQLHDTFHLLQEAWYGGH
jgi:hypothetical protein